MLCGCLPTCILPKENDVMDGGIHEGWLECFFFGK